MNFIRCSKVSMARMQRFLFQFLNILAAISIVHCQSGDSLTPNSSLRNGQSLTSPGGIFQLGFFTPISGSVQGYIAIWYNNSSVTERKVVWIANRNQSVNTSTSILNFTSHGNLILFDKGTDVSWSTGTSTAQNSAQLQLKDSGNLVLTVAGGSDGNGGSKETLWQSFDHPSDTLLPGMRLGVDYRTNTLWQLVSWKSVTNPSPGSYAFKMETRGVPEIFLWNDSSKIFRTGPWNDKGSFSGNPRMKNRDISSQLEFNFVSNSSMVYYSTQYKVGWSVLTRAVMNASGQYERWNWESGGWLHFWSVPEEDCDRYASCGRNSICTWDYSIKSCDCLEGFAPAPKNGSLGCDRKKPLSCASNRVLKVIAKLPDTENATIRGLMSLGACNDVCTNDCSCVAYALVGENGCVTWEGDLLDLRNFPDGGDVLYIRLEGSSRRSKLVWEIAVPVFLAFLLLCIVFFWRRSRAGKQDCNETGPETSSVRDDTSLLTCPSKGDRGDCRSLSPMAFDVSDSRSRTMTMTMTRSRSRSRSINSETYGPSNEGAGRLDILEALPSYDLSTIKAATNDFSIDNKLGEGGFGVVYMAYRLWKDGRSLELLDDALDCSYPTTEILRCIRMALLCVQENTEDRPTMAEVVMMLASEDQLLTPLKQPLIRSMAYERGFTTQEMSITMTGR
ncbi:receptor-like serine/threonine-protein kinase SD1-8 isoform X2 [Zingiber officinale]|uniref:receptor-like serine/threonine-protein kinase SD1-8 isoform X2 n=1 Tax=Zingiber officinale TaxID=94328 RepID=UPI001C4D8692|nr:receptor-like serine/threonine-protein kinase SD1-8 isoform X2 [Zingiber officinale]